jgi:hypothetical protein
MKKSEQYLKDQKVYEFIDSHMSSLYSPDGVKGNYKDRVLNAIKAAQIDAINDTVKLCAERTTGNIYNVPGPGSLQRVSIDEQSILNYAKILLDKL